MAAILPGQGENLAELVVCDIRALGSMQGRMAVVSRCVFGVTAEEIAGDEVGLPDPIEDLVPFFAHRNCRSD